MKPPKEPKERTIRVKVKNKQLNALEDLLYVELSEEQKEKYIKKAKKLWGKLVRAYDQKR